MKIFVGLLLGVILFGINAKFLANTDIGQNETPYYEKLSVDYIITKPGYGQKKELEALPFIKEVTPYYYTQQTFFHNGKSFNVGLHIIEKDADIGNTPFSQKLLIEGTLPKGNEVIIDYRTAKAAQAKPGDNAEIYIGDTKLPMRISGIVQTNILISEEAAPSVLIFCNDEVKKALDKLTKYLAYSGAYIKAADVIQAGEYLKKSYKAKGEIGDPSWYDNPSDYEYRKNDVENTDYSNTITDVGFLKAKAVSANVEKTDHNRNNILHAVAIDLVLYFAAWLIILKAEEKDYTKRINNGTKINTIIKEFIAGQFLCCAITCILTFVVFYGRFPKDVVYVIISNILFFLIVLRLTFMTVKKNSILIKGKK